MTTGIVVIALVCVFIKIISGDKNSSNKKKSDEKVQMSDSITGYSEQYFEDGILYTDDNYIRFCSNDTNEDGLICVQPNCEHKQSRTQDCGAYVDNICTTGFAKRGDNIYYICSEDSAEKYSLYSENLEGKNRKKLVNLPRSNYIFEALYHDNTVYIAYMYKDYSSDSGEVELGIYKYDFESKKGNIYFKTKSYGFSFDGMVIGKDTFYMSYVCSNASNTDILKHKSDKNYEREHSQKFVKGLDIDSGKEKISLDGYGSNSTILYVAGKVFYSVGKSNYYYDESEGKKKKISDADLVPIKSTDKKYAYFMSYNEKTKKRIYMRYDASNDKMITMAEGDYFFCAVYGKKAYLLNADSQKTEYAYVELADLVKGNLSGVKKYKSVWG